MTSLPSLYLHVASAELSSHLSVEGHIKSVPIALGYNPDHAGRHENPHKYLLFKPSAAQVLVYLASGCYDLPPNGALLLYISADALMVPPSKHPEDGKKPINFKMKYKRLE